MTIRARILGLGLMTVVAAGVGAYLALRRLSPPEPCRNSAVVTAMSTECPPGAKMEVYPAGGVMVLVKCVCPPVKK